MRQLLLFCATASLKVGLPFLLLLGAFGRIGSAAPEAGATMVYTIHHEDYGNIGEHRISFSQNGEQLIVDVDVTIEVTVLWMTAFHLEAERQETWRDGRMVGYRSVTDDDGTDISVTGRVDGDRLLIEAPSGRVESFAGTFPTHPWNKAIAGQSVLMDTKTGKLLNVRIANVGEEVIESRGRRIAATKYEMTGDQDREVWFDSEGNWVRLRFLRDGATVTFTLE